MFTISTTKNYRLPSDLCGRYSWLSVKTTKAMMKTCLIWSIQQHSLLSFFVFIYTESHIARMVSTAVMGCQFPFCFQAMFRLQSLVWTLPDCLLWLVCDTDLGRLQRAAAFVSRARGKKNPWHKTTNLIKCFCCLFFKSGSFFCRISWPWGGVAVWEPAGGGDAHHPDRVRGRRPLHPGPV